MTTKYAFKFVMVAITAGILAGSAGARPEYLRIFAADPLSRPELRSSCGVCHINPQGGGPRNEFGAAFAAAGRKITPELREKFPDRFVPDVNSQSSLPVVRFPAGSDSEAIVELNGAKYVVNTREHTVKPFAAGQVETAPAKPGPRRAEKAAAANDDIFEPVDVRVINLPTAISMPKGSLWIDFTHRFPFNEVADKSLLLGLDGFAIPSFGVTYGITDHIHAGAYRSSSLVGRPIAVFAGATLLEESKGQQLNLMGRVTLEGRDNFQRNFSTTLELALARSITRHAQIYVVPAVTFGDRPLSVSPARNFKGRTAPALGIGAAVSVRPSVSLMAEANFRLSESARYEGNRPEYGLGIHRPVVGFAIEKASASRRHSFTLTFTNGPGTTSAQRSMTRGLFFGDDSLGGMTIGFNLTRRLF